MADAKVVGMRHGGEEGAVGNSREERCTARRDAGTNAQPEPTASAKGLCSEDILDAIPHSIAVLDPEGTVVYANQGFLDYTGLSIEEIMAPTLRARVFHPDDIARVQQERAEGLSRGLPFENEQRARGKDGRYRWFLIRYTPARDQHGRILHWYATGTDIEDRKQAEERLRQDERELRQLIDFLPQHVVVLSRISLL